jgi:hypothetical protein
MFRWFSAVKGATKVSQASRPVVVEGLEGRRLMSATLTGYDAGAAAAAASVGGGGGGAGKVSMQDFHFVMRSIATSIGAGAGAGKVSMQDFHFVMR